MNSKALLAHIRSRLLCRPQDARHPTPENGSLARPGHPVNLADYGVETEPQEFNYPQWFETPMPGFGERTPQQVIDKGTETDHRRLAEAADAIAAHLDGAFA